MILFWLLAAAMAGLVLLMILPAMVRAPGGAGIDQAEQNIAIARQKLADLEDGHRRGDVPAEDYEASRAELEQSLALDLAQLRHSREHEPDSHSSGDFSTSSMAIAIIIAFAVPVAAGAVYLMVGEPAAIVGSVGSVDTSTANQGGAGSQSIDAMMDQLKARLAQNPDDARGWSILARSSMQLERYDDAAAAYARLNDLIPGDADILVQYADALAMQAGGVLDGRPTELIERALEIDSGHPQGLWLAGMSAQRRGEFRRAMEYWNTLLPKLEQDPQSLEELRGLIVNLVEQARSAGVDLPVTNASTSAGASGNPAPTQAALGDASLTVRVGIDDALSEYAEPTATVFVFARASSGPPMPLAAARKRVSDLPFEVVLDDSSAMAPNMRLSSFETVDVVARVSQSGQPTAASGDLEGMIANVSTTGSDTLDILISRRLP